MYDDSEDNNRGPYDKEVDFGDKVNQETVDDEDEKDEDDYETINISRRELTYGVNISLPIMIMRRKFWNLNWKLLLKQLRKMKVQLKPKKIIL